VGLLAILLAIAGCSGGGGSYDSTDSYSINKEAGNVNSNVSDNYDSEKESTHDLISQENQTSQMMTNTIDREMLIYSCDVKIDTLDYEESVNTFKVGLKEIGGFVENEYFSDGAGDYGYYIEESEKTKNYTATVRIPSQKYDSFVTSLGELGDVRSQEATVENVSQEYKDAEIQLKILEAKEAAYLKMLKKAKTTNEIVTMQDTLTELQVQIEQLKSRMHTIETGVAYSFINIEISEVARYQDKLKETDTFFQRLSNTITETTAGFLEFLEWLLFTFIRLFPYAVIFAIVLPIISRIKKWYRKKHPKIPKSRGITQTQAIKKGQDGKEIYVAPDYNQEQSNDDSNSNNN